ncbi:MAG: hypothetical protein GH151_12880 [Bacteroidetes bacterium]|nr:hypothetical protein [Bacteroidota bacterium]
MALITKLKIPGLILAGLFSLQPATDEEQFYKTLTGKIEIYKKKFPKEIVYIQTDKNVYVPGENLFFKAYVKDVYSIHPSLLSQNLYLILLDSDGEETANKIFKIENGQAAGKITLHNTLNEGKYTFIGYTDLMQKGNPENVFVKTIFLKKIDIPNIFVKISAPDTIFHPTEEAIVNVHLVKSDGKPLSKKSFTYVVKLNGESYTYGKGKSDKRGKAVIKANLPEHSVNSIVTVEATVKHTRITERNSIVIPTKKTPINLEFFPESGNFINGLETKVSFKATDLLGNPVDIEGQILEKSNKIVTTFKSMEKGIGYFTITPEINNPLKVKITYPHGINQLYDLPEIFAGGIVLSLENATNDFLSFKISTNRQNPPDFSHCILEMEGQLVWHKSFLLKNRFTFQIPVKDLPGGKMQCTIFDINGQPIAQRAVFLNKPNHNVEVKTAKNTYKSHEEINLNIRVQHHDGDPAPADLSVAVTDANLNPNWNNAPDIFSHFTLGPSTKENILPPGYLIKPKKEAYEIIDCFMLTLKEEKYDWKVVRNIENYTTQQRIAEDFSQEIKELFQLDDYNKIVEKVETDQFFYKYILKDDPVLPEFLSVNKSILGRPGTKNYKLRRIEQLQKALGSGNSILDVMRTIRPYELLDGDKIVFRGPNSFLNQSGALIVVDGQKWGTSANLLNSLNPHDIYDIQIYTDPVDMLTYTGLNSNGVIEITTKRGDSGKDWSDQSLENQLSSYQTTLYWNPYVNTMYDGKISVPFESSKLKTKYNIVVQGIDLNGRPVCTFSNISVY